MIWESSSNRAGRHYLQHLMSTCIEFTNVCICLEGNTVNQVIYCVLNLSYLKFCVEIFFVGINEGNV